jgi:sulfate permease, SulP family
MALAAILSLMIGAILVCAGFLRLGAIANLLSVPVTTGFLAGIAGHIVVSQAPAILGMESPGGSMTAQIAGLAANLGATNPITLTLGLGVLAIMIASERMGPRIPGALIGLAGATLLVAAFHLEARGVSTLGDLARVAPHFIRPIVAWSDVILLIPLALIVSIVIMVQTASKNERTSASNMSHRHHMLQSR